MKTIVKVLGILLSLFDESEESRKEWDRYQEMKMRGRIGETR